MKLRGFRQPELYSLANEAYRYFQARGIHTKVFFVHMAQSFDLAVESEELLNEAVPVIEVRRPEVMESRGLNEDTVRKCAFWDIFNQLLTKAWALDRNQHG